MSNEKRYLFIEGGDKCPEGSDPTNVGGPNTYCRTLCPAGGDCSGYPGVSLSDDGSSVNIKSSTPWNIPSFFVKDNGNDNCNFCSLGSNDCNVDAGNCCAPVAGGNKVDCPLTKDQHSAWLYPQIKYKGEECQIPCDDEEGGCVLRLPNSGNCGSNPPKKYKCVTKGKPCKEDESGTYDDLDKCNKDCGGPAPPSGKAWACQDGVCQNLGAGNGNYGSQTECENDESSICYTGGGAPAKGGKGGAIIVALSVLAAIILLAIIGMFVYLFLTGKKGKGEKVGSFRFCRR